MPPNAAQACHQLRYHTEQNEVFYWIVKTASNLLEDNPSSVVKAILEKQTPKPTCFEVQTLAAFIGQHLKPVPDKILTLFERVINDRTKTCQDYQKTTAKSTDPQVKYHNDMHRRWVVGLTIAFNSFGGRAWRARAISSITKTNRQQLIFSNRFSALAIDETIEEREEKAKSVANESEDPGSDFFDPFAEPPDHEDLFFDPAARQHWTWKPARKKKKKPSQKRWRVLTVSTIPLDIRTAIVEFRSPPCTSWQR
ncbi:hypothetical protein N7451_007837 [Penicillium sp. IBT 35674x]|nr:hypothetical protein N7451_007837 [Penicillium sp. IBT 35674x]